MRHEKQFLLNEIKEQISTFGSFVVMQYVSLSANKANELRREVHKIGGNVEVMRKRVLLKAAEGTGVSFNLKELPGHIGLVYAGNEPLEVAKLVFKFSQENGQAVKVLGGRFEGTMYNAQNVEMLSKLPGKEQMRAEFLSVLEAPMSQTLAVMDALLASVVYCLDNKCQLEQESSGQEV